MKTTSKAVRFLQACGLMLAGYVVVLGAAWLTMKVIL